jgi:hypothetical protein
MRDFRWLPSRKSWPFLLLAAACLAPGAAQAQVPVTRVITVQPIDVCSSTGQLCAPFNTNSQIGSPKTQNSTTNPIGFVYSYTNPTTNAKVYIDITRALLNQVGIDVVWNRMVQFNSPIINSSTKQTYQTLNVITNNSACGLPPAIPQTGLQSCDFLNLSQQGAISRGIAPNPTFPNAPVSTIPSVVNMFFVNTLNPPPAQTGSQLYGFSWINNNGISIGSNTFFPPAPLTPLVDVLAHELLHNAGLDHTHWGAGPYNPISVDPNGGALQTTLPGVIVGECDLGYPACMANLLSAGNLRTIPTVNCVAVSNPPLPGQTPCPGMPSFATGDADQLTTKVEEWSGLPTSQQRVVSDPTPLAPQTIPLSTTTVSVPANSNSMTVTVTGATNGGSNTTLLAWVFLPPGALKFDSHFQFFPPPGLPHLLQDADWPHPDQDNNTTNGVYNLGTLYDVCAAETAQCLIVEFNQPYLGANATVKFTKGFTTPITNASLCGAKIASIFGHGYMTISQLACPGGVAPSPLTANSWQPDLTAPVPAQIVNQTAYNAIIAGNASCNQGSSGQCPPPELTGVADANPSEEKQVCYFHGQPVPCP